MFVLKIHVELKPEIFQYVLLLRWLPNILLHHIESRLHSTGTNRERFAIVTIFIGQASKRVLYSNN